LTYQVAEIWHYAAQFTIILESDNEFLQSKNVVRSFPSLSMLVGKFHHRETTNFLTAFETPVIIVK
jgi:hypothetical protein